MGKEIGESPLVIVLQGISKKIEVLTSTAYSSGGGGGGIPEAPIDGQQYGRQSAAWTVITGGGGATGEFKYSQSLATIVKADTGLAYTTGQIVQVKNILPPDPLNPDPKTADWDIYTVTDVSPSDAFAIPTVERLTYVGPADAYPHYHSGAAGDGVALQFRITDANDGTIPNIDWELTSLYVEGTYNSQDRANARYSIYSDVAGEPGVELYNWNQFDWSNSIVDGETSRIIEAITPLALSNGTNYWLVGKFSDISLSANYLLVDDDPFLSASTYITVDPTAVNRSRVTIDDGLTWTYSPGVLWAPRVYPNIKRTTPIEVPVVQYGFILEPTDDTTFGTMLILGSLLGDTTGASVGEVWLDNDFLFVDFVTKQLTNVRPVLSKDVIIAGQVYIAAAVNGSLIFSANITGMRGVYLTNAVYDPRKIYGDVFNLSNIDRGTLASARVDTDDSTWIVISGLDAQEVFNSIDTALQSAKATYDGVYATEAEILALSATTELGKTMWAVDTKAAYHAVTLTSVTPAIDVWQNVTPVYSAITDSYDMPPTQDGQKQNLGRELISLGVNNSLAAVTSLVPKVFLLTDPNLTYPDFNDGILIDGTGLFPGAKYGLNTTDAVVGGTMKVLRLGDLNGVDTSAWPQGSSLYVDLNTPGDMTINKPTINAYLIATVEVSDPINGVLVVNTTTAIDLISNTEIFSGVSYYFSGDISPVDGVALSILSNSKGTVSTNIIGVADDNQTSEGSHRLILDPVLTAASQVVAGVYQGKLQVSCSTSQASERVYVEIYKASAVGVPIDVAPLGELGSLGINAVTIHRSTVLNMVANTMTDISVSAEVLADIPMAIGETFLYVPLFEKLGTTGGAKTFTMLTGPTGDTYIQGLGTNASGLVPYVGATQDLDLGSKVLILQDTVIPANRYKITVASGVLTATLIV